VRETIVFAVQEALDFAEAPDTSDVAEATIDVDVDVSAMKPGRRLLVSGAATAGTEHAEDAIVKDVQAVGGRWRIVLQGDLSTAYERETVVVHGNVPVAPPGGTAPEPLGSARAPASFQRATRGPG